MALTPGDPFTGNLTAKIDASGLAKDTTVQAVNTTLGSPAQDATVTAVKTTLGAPAQDATVTAVKTTLGAPAQDATVTAVKTTLGSPAQDATVTSVKTTLGSPAQDANLTQVKNNQTNGTQLSAPITKSSSLANGVSKNLAATGGQAILPTSTTFYSITRPSYDINITLLENSAPGGNAGTVEIDMLWTDSTSGLIVAEESWYVFPGSFASSTAHTIHGKGPTKGDQLQVQITNNGTVIVNAVTTLVQSSRTYAVDDWRSATFIGATGFALPNSDLQAMIVAGTAPSVAAGGTQVRLMPLFSGQVSVEINPPAQAIEVFINQLDPTSSAGSRIWGAQLTASQNDVNGMAFLPRSQCTITMINHGSASGTINVSVTGLPHT